MKKKLAEIFNLVFGFRKFIAWVALFLVAIVFRITNQVDGGQFVDLIKSTFVAFVAANGAEHVINVVKQYVAAKGQGVPVPPPADAIVPIEEREGDE